MTAFIQLAIADTNQGYSNTRIPIQLVLKCIVDAPIVDVADMGKQLEDFKNSASKMDLLPLTIEIVVNLEVACRQMLKLLKHTGLTSR